MKCRYFYNFELITIFIAGGLVGFIIGIVVGNTIIK